MKQRPWHRWYEDGVPTSLDVEHKAVTEYLRNSAEKYPDNIAVVFENCRLTYRQLEARVNSFANALAVHQSRPCRGSARTSSSGGAPCTMGCC